MQTTVLMKCPYCGASASRVDSSRIYGRSYGLVYLCDRYPKCDAYVGCHKDGTAKGTLANPKLRELRKKAHALFDPLWKEKVFESRSAAYKWLSKEMNTSHKQTHIAMFDEQQCLKCIELLKLLYEVAQEEVAQDEMKLRKAAYALFNKLWQEGKFSRKAGYKWLSQQMNIPLQKTRIRLFNEQQCHQCIELLRKY